MNRSRYLSARAASGAGYTATGIRTPEAFLLEGAARGIPLHHRDGTIRGFATVDAADFARFGLYRWHVRVDGRHRYVVRHSRVRGKYQRRYLHREILGLASGDPLRVDHINRDALDNRRCNLRAATDAQNAQNQLSRGGLSKYRGVTWRNDRNRWRACHWLNGKLHYIGTFEDEDEAGRAAAAWRAAHMPFSQEALILLGSGSGEGQTQT